VISGYGAGAVDYLTKPLNPVIVRHKVAVFADLFRKTRALAELNEKLEERVRERTADLEKSEAALRVADHKKDEFIAILAHELRNPLAPLRFGLDILGKESQSTPMSKKTLGTMNRQLDHMVRLIDDLLDISRVSRGSIELKKERVDLVHVVETAIDITRPFLDRSNHTLRVQTKEPLFAFGDATRLAQIVGNLLHNAAKFTPAGGQISVELARERSHAVVRVIDSGEGLAADQIERAFEMFARVNSPGVVKSEPGLGIGLALARRLAELHQGTLTGASEGAGRGATFTLRLPALEDHMDTTTHESSSPAQKTGKLLDIVVIEDSEDVAETLAMWLEGLGHRVKVAKNGPLGIDLVLNTHPDLVLCDLGLPDMDGIEVCRRVRRLSLTSQPRMVALTGWGREDDRRRTREAGFDDHLVKPVAAEKLQSVLRTVAQ
jgi:signal transduction histidine kinase